MTTATEADSRLKEIVSRQNVDLDSAPSVAELIDQVVTAALAAVDSCSVTTPSREKERNRVHNAVTRALLAKDFDSSENMLRAIESEFLARELYQEAQAVTYMLVSASDGELDHQVRLVRRNRQIVPWSVSKIESAVRRAFISVHVDPSPALAVAKAVTARVKAEANALVGIEDVQDMVQEELMRQGHFAVASHYIIYRAERSRLRGEHGGDDATPVSDIVVVNGRVRAPLSVVELRRRINYACTGLTLCLTKAEILKELLRSVGAEITESDLKHTIILNAKTLLEKDADFAKFAARILLTYIYEEVLDWNILRDGLGRLKKAHHTGFKAYLKRAVKIDRIAPELLTRYDLDELASKLDPSADMDFDYLGIQTLYDRYLLVDKTGKRPRRLETPQFFWMRVAMGLFKEEGRDEAVMSEKSNTTFLPRANHYAIQLYNLYKSRRFCSSTPTLFNSGTLHSQLSSCYILDVQDSLESIFDRGISDSAKLAKWAGGLGGSWSKVRGTGARINGTNGESQGVIPFLKVYNDMLLSTNQGGKRKGSGCNYLATWHNDIEDFMELRKNVGDDRRRCHDMNTAHWIPDLFMKRMEARQDWSLFYSNDVSDLTELYGQAFEKRYEEYEAMAADGKIWTRKLPALELWKTMLKAIFETGHPWLCWSDPCNVRSPQDHVGVVHSSNLCCMTADQRVVTDKGIVTVGALYTEQLEWDRDARDVNVLAGRDGLTVHAGPMLLPRPGAPIVSIVTKEGYTHKVTLDHRVAVVGRGWVEARHLEAGDLLEIQQTSLFGEVDEPELAFIAGLVAGDGSFMKGADSNVLRLDLTEDKTIHLKDRVLAATWQVIAESGVKVGTNGNLKPEWKTTTHGVRINTSALGKALVARGISGETRTKVPEFVWRGNRETVAAYVYGVFMADGGVASTATQVTVRLSMIDEGFLKEIQLLLANFKIKCSVFPVREAGEKNFDNGTYPTETMFALGITSRDGVALFEDTFGFITERARFRKGAQQALSIIAVAGGNRSRQKMTAEFVRLEDLPAEDAYCLAVDSEDHAWTVNGLITHNTEITLNTDAESIAVCNLGSVLIDEHLTPDGAIDHPKLEETVTLAVRALDNVIDINFYPVEATRTSNMRHRPIGLGMMGLQNALHRKGMAFASQEAVEFNDEITEAIAYYAYMASSKLAKEKGRYATYEGSKWDRGLLPQDTIDLLQEERGILIDTPRGGKLDWTPVRNHIGDHGMRNSNVMALAPTACVTPETLVSGPGGLLAMEEIGDMAGAQWQPVSYDVHQSGEPTEATKFYLNGHRKVRLVRTSLGHQTRGTDTHRLKVLMPSGELEWKYLPDLEPGDLVLHKLGGFNPSATVALKASVTGKHPNAIPVTLPKTLNEPLACFLGAYMANGYIKYKTSGVPEGVKISITNNKATMLQELRDIGVAWGVYTGDESCSGQTTVCFYSKELAEWFIANGWDKPRGNCGEGAAGAFIPVQVRRSPRAVVAHFLRGLFTDGTLGFQVSGAPCLDYSTVSDTLAYQLHALLWAMGFTAKKTTVRPGTLGQRPVNRIRISNVYSTRAFLAECGWFDADNLDRALAHDLGPDSYRGLGVTAVPLIAEIAAIIERPNPKIGKDLRVAMAGAKNQSSLGWVLLNRLAAAEPAIKLTKAWLYRESGIVFLPVVENEEESELQPTCDLEVPGSHEYVAGGMVNHNTISCLMATTPCIEPNYKNLFVKSNMSGDFTSLSENLVRELKALGLWGQDMLDQLKYHDGELEMIPGIPDEVKARHLTVFGIPYEFIIDAAARRQKWIDQAQSLNLFMTGTSLKTLSLMYRRAWAAGLKTTYYLRTMGASGIEKSTVDEGKALRGVMAEAAPVMQCRIDDPTCESCQ